MRRSLAPRRPAMAAAARNPRNPRRCATIFAELAPFVSFADYLGLRLVDRAWRLYCRRVGHAPPPFPWLLLPEREPPAAAGPRRATARGVFYDIPGGRSYGYQVPSRDVHRCVATGHGWLVMAAVEAQEPRRIVLVNPITDEQRFFSWPFAKWNVRFHAVLTSSPIDESCFLVVVTDRLLAFCRPDDFQGGWQTLRAPGFRYHAALSDVVSVGSTVYLVDERRRLWRVDLADENPKVQRRDTGFALPSQETRRQYLVESLGHVLLVLSDDRHNRVALYKLNWEARAWLPTASCPGERVLLLGRGCSAAVPSSSAAGRAPGSVLFAYQPSTMPDVDGAVRGVVGGQAWFWSESRVGAVPGDLLVLKKTVSHRHGELPTTGDSFWFFPAVDPDENA